MNIIKRGQVNLSPWTEIEICCYNCGTIFELQERDVPQSKRYDGVYSHMNMTCPLPNCNTGFKIDLNHGTDEYPPIHYPDHIFNYGARPKKDSMYYRKAKERFESNVARERNKGPLDVLKTDGKGPLGLD